MSDSARADKWLWATRFFKTRNQAAGICADGKVRRNGLPVKPATSLHVGDVLELPFLEGPGMRTIKILGLVEKRVGAATARELHEDQTPEAVHLAQKEWHLARRDAPKGRPTKRNRRELDRIHGFWDVR